MLHREASQTSRLWDSPEMGVLTRITAIWAGPVEGGRGTGTYVRHLDRMRPELPRSYLMGEER